MCSIYTLAPAAVVKGHLGGGGIKIPGHSWLCERQSGVLKLEASPFTKRCRYWLLEESTKASVHKNGMRKGNPKCGPQTGSIRIAWEFVGNRKTLIPQIISPPGDSNVHYSLRTTS